MVVAATRRAVLGAIATAPLIAITAATDTVTASVINPEWDRLVASFDTADARMKALAVEHTAASEAYQIARKGLRARPEAPGVAYPRPITEMTVGELRDLTVAPERQAAYEADFAAWNDEQQALDRAIMGDVDERWNDAVDAQDRAAHAIFAHPAPNAEALVYKLDLLQRAYHGCDIDSTTAKHVLADVRRFVGGVA
jgi:hypothetical protein